MALVSVIIPSKKGAGKLSSILPKYKHQVFKDFEIIVVDDNDESYYTLATGEVAERNGAKLVKSSGVGAAAARNTGAIEATGKYLFFVGDDCIPDRKLLFNHVYHRTSPISQGFSPFHPCVMDTYFMHFLDRSGIQANWYSLLDKNGNWKRIADGFCLTTNFFIEKDIFVNEGMFDTSFPGAAWEDVELGHRLRQYGYNTEFIPDAINYHFHRYTFTKYTRRQIAEGKNRPILASTTPELAGGVLDLAMIREADRNRGRKLEVINNSLDLIRSAFVLKEARNTIDDKLRHNLGLFSFWGLLEAIEDTEWMILTELKSKMSPVHVASAIKSLNTNQSQAYIQHCILWLRQEEGYTDAVKAFEALMEGRFGDNEKARELLASVKETRWTKYVKEQVYA